MYLDLHQNLTNTVIKQLQQGIAPWQLPWKEGKSFPLPVNKINGKPYKGINIPLLWHAAETQGYTSHDWATLKQWRTNKESIRKGEIPTMAIRKDKAEKRKPTRFPLIEILPLFNHSQLTGYSQACDSPKQLKPVSERIAKIDDFINNTQANIQNEDYGALYLAATDTIYMPYPLDYSDREHQTASEVYYCDIFHQMIHWTMHPCRLNRRPDFRLSKKEFIEEELIAEMGTAFLCAEFEIMDGPKPYSEGLRQDWIKFLKKDLFAINNAATDAAKAVDYLHKIQRKPEPF